ncbi:gamma carbonic anhydrase family protein [bacterium]|nr:gamma carbonic anhydrase family protein [bacterium]
MIISFRDKIPMIGKDVFIADSAHIIGDVTIGDRSSIWYNAVLRGDLMPITIGTETNIQDGAVLHITSDQWPCIVGNRVTVGHAAVVNACTVEDDCLIGMGAIILDGAIIEKKCMIAAGAVVRPGVRIPSGVLAAGTPAQIKRNLTPEELEFLSHAADEYLMLAREFPLHAKIVR